MKLIAKQPPAKKTIGLLVLKSDHACCCIVIFVINGKSYEGTASHRHQVYEILNNLTTHLRSVLQGAHGARDINPANMFYHFFMFGMLFHEHLSI